MAKKKAGDPKRDIAVNRKARFNYEIGEVFEVGIVLTGTEVKSLRVGKATIAEFYADTRGDEIWLYKLEHPRIPASQPQQSRAAPGTKASPAPPSDQQADWRDRARGDDNRSTQALF